MVQFVCESAIALLVAGMLVTFALTAGYAVLGLASMFAY